MLQYVFGYATVILGEIADYASRRVDVTSFHQEDYVGVNELLPGFMGREKCSHEPSEEKCIAFAPGDVLLGNIRPYLKKMWRADCSGGTNGDVLVIKPKSPDIVDSGFLFHRLATTSFVDYNVSHSRGAKMPRGNKEAIMQYRFMLPTIERQRTVADQLTKFEKLANDSSGGLHAEIDARQRQYEYYRDRLLDFREAGE